MVDELTYCQQRLAVPTFFDAGPPAVFEAGPPPATSGMPRPARRRPRRPRRQVSRRSRIPEQERIGALRHIAEIRAVLAASRPGSGEDALPVDERRAG